MGPRTSGRSVAGSLVLLVGLAGPAPAQDERALEPYQACLEVLMEEAADARQIERCQQAAEAGIPTAQYVLGLLLLEDGGEARIAAALRWLRLAAERGHPGAQLETSRMLREGSAGEARPGEADRYLRRALCSGLPQARSEALELGLDVPALEATCERPTWVGSWTGEVQWVHATLGTEEPRGRSTVLRLELGEDVPRVFTEHDGQWIELKPGAFRWAERGTNAILVAFDEGWDLDGRWAETSNLSLVRISADELEVLWTRMIHNEHMPSTLEGRTLGAVARGRLGRVGSGPSGPAEE